jgi:hypothetical protein
VKRADRNHWGVLIAAVLAANIIPPILFLKTDTTVSVGITALFAVALFFLSRRFTSTRRWWVLPLLGSPFVVLPLLLGVLLIGMFAGIVPVP